MRNKRLYIAILPVVISLSFLSTTITRAEDFDISKLIIVNHGDNFDLEEYIATEIDRETATEDSIFVFWDTALKPDATKEQIDTAYNAASKVCYIPKREEYFLIIDEANRQLSEREKEEKKEQSLIVSRVLQEILLIYNPETKQIENDFTTEEILSLYEQIDKIKDGEVREHYLNLMDEINGCLS